MEYLFGGCLRRPGVGPGKGLPLFVSPPAPGGFVGRAISPAAGALRHRRVCGTMQASSPTKHRARSCRFYRIFPSQSGNAPSVYALRRSHLPLQGRLSSSCPPQKASPVRGGGIASAMTEGCRTLPRQYPSGLAQGPLAGVNARPTMQGIRAAQPGTAGVVGDDGCGVPPLCVGADDFIGPAAGLTVG